MKWIAYVHDIAWTAADGTPLSGFAYTYDAAGNVTRIVRDGRPTLDLTWNGQYQLVSVATNGVFAEGYAYDALGRRASTTTWEGTVRHVYDDNWQVIADLDSNGNVLRSYVWGEGIDRLLAVKVGAKSYAALTDAQGTVWGLVGGDGEIVARWTYDAWGYVLSEEVTDPDLAAFRYRFQGREYSAATGLVNFRARWYDPETGRWLSKDPIRIMGGLNQYEFCNGQPHQRRDPDGLRSDDDDDDDDRPYLERYFEYTTGLMIDPVYIIKGWPIGVIPKKWAPATGGRGPAFGSKNPWTSVPRGFGFGRGPMRPILRSTPFRIVSGITGGTILGVGVWNFGVAVGGLIGAAYAD